MQAEIANAVVGGMRRAAMIYNPIAANETIHRIKPLENPTVISFPTR